uniref:Uncharacterized protein n=1 Tax=Accipiter nisus TaxID=211598 RepID=A0A8B9RUB5_9AVES
RLKHLGTLKPFASAIVLLNTVVPEYQQNGSTILHNRFLPPILACYHSPNLSPCSHIYLADYWTFSPSNDICSFTLGFFFLTSNPDKGHTNVKLCYLFWDS